MLHCRKLSVEGEWLIGPEVVFEGDVKLVNTSGTLKELRKGTYSNATVGA
jgi:hypothetical protein